MTRVRPRAEPHNERLKLTRPFAGAQLGRMAFDRPEERPHMSTPMLVEQFYERI